MALFRAPRVALVACAAFLVAACDDPVGTTDPPPADAALLVGATGALRAVPADARGTPREIGRVGDRVYRCAARIDGLGVLLTVADSTTANRRFVVVDPRTGERRREIALAPIERATPDSARLDVAFPFFCTVDARGTRIAVPGRAAGRNGVAILALDDPRLVAFLPGATFPGLAFGRWRDREALLIARYPAPTTPLSRLQLVAHDPATLAPFDSVVVPASEQAFSVRVVTIPGAPWTVVIHAGRASLCQPAGCSVARGAMGGIGDVTPVTRPGGATWLLAMPPVLGAWTPLPREVLLLTPTGEVVERHAFGSVYPTSVTPDAVTGLWVVTATTRIPFAIGLHTSASAVQDLASSWPARPLLPDVVITYDPVRRRELRRDPLPIGTAVAVAVR